MEGIPYLGAKFYSFISKKSPMLKDMYKDVSEEITTKILKL